MDVGEVLPFRDYSANKFSKVMKHSSVVLFGAVKERENKPRISHSLQGLDVTQYTREKGKEAITILNKTVDGSTAGF